VFEEVVTQGESIAVPVKGVAGSRWLAREGCTCKFAVVRVCGEGSICVRISRAVFCKIDVISEFAVSARDCGEIFFPRS